MIKKVPVLVVMICFSLSGTAMAAKRPVRVPAAAAAPLEDAASFSKALEFKRCRVGIIETKVTVTYNGYDVEFDQGLENTLQSLDQKNSASYLNDEQKSRYAQLRNYVSNLNFDEVVWKNSFVEQLRQSSHINTFYDSKAYSYNGSGGDKDEADPLDKCVVRLNLVVTRGGNVANIKIGYQIGRYYYLSDAKGTLSLTKQKVKGWQDPTFIERAYQNYTFEITNAENVSATIRQYTAELKKALASKFK